MPLPHKPIQWGLLTSIERDKILEWSHLQESRNGKTEVYCSYCDASFSFMGDINRISYLTAEEQEHMDSETHIANALLAKLANEIK